MTTSQEELNRGLALAIQENSELRKQLVYGFHLGDAPDYRQGPSIHEQQELTTAEEANGLVQLITQLRKALQDLHAECLFAGHRFDRNRDQAWPEVMKVAKELLRE
jgi:hypothetical protein